MKCTMCGSFNLKKIRESKSTGSGCLLVVIGAVLCVALIGIPILIFGIHLMLKCDGFWLCRDCRVKHPRALRWWEFG